jgi:bifunctional non-homologous end joining protein LigD
MAAAKDVRARLMACGLVPFLKTTGGKGLHVVAPIKGTPKNPATWSAAKAFARALCRAVEDDDPAHYTTNMSKAKRGGKIFLDYLRNDRMATAVAPWSPRARPHAPISVPLSWNRLTAKLDPQVFTIATARPLLKRTDPWKEMEKSARPLAAARKKIGL